MTVKHIHKMDLEYKVLVLWSPSVYDAEHTMWKMVQSLPELAVLQLIE